MNQFLSKKTEVSSRVVSRIITAVFLQNYYSPVCDYNNPQVKLSATTTTQDEKSLVGQTILITGGGIGIGYETAKALVEYGASVIIASRNKAKLMEAYASLRPLCKHGNTIDYFELDLSDLNDKRYADDKRYGPYK